MALNTAQRASAGRVLGWAARAAASAATNEKNDRHQGKRPPHDSLPGTGWQSLAAAAVPSRGLSSTRRLRRIRECPLSP